MLAMTIESHCVVDLSDISILRCACTICGSTLTVPISQFRTLQPHCPGCENQWLIGGSAIDTALQRLIRSIKDLTAVDDAKVRFSLESRK